MRDEVNELRAEILDAIETVEGFKKDWDDSSPLVGVVSVGLPDLQKSARRLVDIPTSGARPIE